MSNDENHKTEASIKAVPINANFSKLMKEILGASMKSHDSLRTNQDDLGRASVLGIPIQTR